MTPTIRTIIDAWTKADSSFFLERRMAAALSPQNTSSPKASLVMTFIIDSKGYFYDKQLTKVIPLHAEETIVIDDLKAEEELSKVLSRFTQSSHESFNKLLTSVNGPVYTQDKH